MEIWLGLLAGVLVSGGILGKDKIADTIQEALPAWNRFDAIFKKWAAVYNVNWHYLKAIALNESSLGDAPSVARGLEAPFDVESSKSYDGLSWGLMQVTIRTAQDYDSSATPEKLNDPDYSVKLAANIFADYGEMFSDADPRWLEWTVKSYNQGPGNTRKEIAGQVKGYAQAYWERFQRNYSRVQGDT